MPINGASPALYEFLIGLGVCMVAATVLVIIFAWWTFPRE